MKLWDIISWLLLLFIAPSAGDLDLSRALPPLGPLGVTLDYPFATNWPRRITGTMTRNWSYSSHLVFTQPVHEIFSERELWAIGWHAYREMRADMSQYEIETEKHEFSPGAFSVLAWGHEIILVSSQKGLQSFSYLTPNTPILRDLNICATAWRDEGNPEQLRHGNQGKCGEEMASHLYALFNRDHELGTRDPSISTWVRTKEDWDLADPIAPCGLPGQWGCNRFIVQHGLRELPMSAAPSPGERFNLRPWEGKEFTVNQYQLCGRIRYTKIWNPN